MKTSLLHLPRDKQEQLAAITKILCDGAPLEKVILFGSYARGDWVEDFETEYFSDYDILVIVKDKGLAEDASLWTALSIEARAVSGNVPVNLIVHDLKSVNRELRKGQYFFTDVLNEGVLLHDARRHELAKSKVPTLAQLPQFGGAGSIISRT
jgi:predicted nucleotidyltransferase